MFWELSVYLHSVSCVESCLYVVCMCLQSWTCVCMYLHILRAERVSLFVCMYTWWSACVHVPARIKSQACICACSLVLRARHVSAYIEGWECGCMRLNLAKAESVPACVCACLESGIFLHLSRADQVSLYVGHYQELSMCACFQSNVICCERSTDTTAICRNRIQLSKQDKYTWISINMYMYVYVYMYAKYLWKCDEDHPNDGKFMYPCLCTWVPFQVLI